MILLVILAILVIFTFFVFDVPTVISNFTTKIVRRNKLSFDELMALDRRDQAAHKALITVPSNLYADSLMAKLETQWDLDHPSERDQIEQLKRKVNDLDREVIRLTDLLSDYSRQLPIRKTFSAREIEEQIAEYKKLYGNNMFAVLTEPTRKETIRTLEGKSKEVWT